MAGLMPVCDRIVKLFSERMQLTIPSVDTDLFETGALDSLAFVELLLHLEQEFGIKVSIDDLELDNFRSIARIAEFITNGNGKTPEPCSSERDLLKRAQGSY